MIYLPYIGKVCRACLDWYPFDQLVKIKHSPDGHDRFCIFCNRKRASDYQKQNREKANKRKGEWQRARPDKRKEYQKRYYASHKAQVYQRNDNWRRNNAERWNTYLADYNKSPVGKANKTAQWLRRRSRVLSLPSTFTGDQWKRAQEYFGYRCAICGCTRGLWHIIAADHWIPITSPDCPGTVATNMIPLCHGRKGGTGGCNRSKHNKSPYQWLCAKFGKRKADAIMQRIQDYFEWVHQQDDEA